LDVSSKSDVSSFKCGRKDKEWCSKVLEYLRTELHKEVFTWKEEHGYDQPSAARELLGLIRYINEFTE
jgi:hypothetical protein